MKTGLFISLLLHAGILAWAVVSIEQTKPKAAPTPKPIVVDISNISDLTRAKKGETKKKPPKKAEKKPPVKAKPKPKAKPVPQKTAALPPPKSEPPQPNPIKDLLKKKPPKPKAEPPKPVVKKTPDQTIKPKPKKAEKKPAPKPKPKPVKAKPKPKKKAEAKPKPRPKKVVRKTRKKVAKRKATDFDTESIAALLNKIPDAKAGPKPKKVTRKRKVAAVEAEQGAPTGANDKLTASEFDFFIRQIGNCFGIPAGAKDAEDFRPTVEFRMRRDGSVDGVPKVVNNVNSPFFQIAAEASVRAILECQPYSLPKDKYDEWKKAKITFDLKAMLGN
ncbi:MAG: hypothetical protein AAGJ70_05505 [Pseudomonadota bacterium]